MIFKKKLKKSTNPYLANLEKARLALMEADAILIGIGAGMSESAGFNYSGERFERYFSDFKEKYGIEDMYSGGFFKFSSREEYWAWWSRQIYYNRYDTIVGKPYKDLLELVKDKNYFVLLTNVDHQIQKAGFKKERLFYTQGDYGLFQCSVPCHEETYNNEKLVRQMIEKQKNLEVPSELIPHCPKCGAEMMLNLRADNRFVEDEGWHQAKSNYSKWLSENVDKKIVYLELGVGMNTPVIIKYPFLKMTVSNPKATFITINQTPFVYPDEVQKQMIQFQSDIGEVLAELR